jgi:hypothetical protein
VDVAMQAGFPFKDISFSFDPSQSPVHSPSKSPEKVDFSQRRIVHVLPPGERVRPSAKRSLAFDDENRAGMKRVLTFPDRDAPVRRRRIEPSGDDMDIEEVSSDEFEQDLELDYYTSLAINDEMLVSIASGYSNPEKIIIPHCKNVSDAAFEQIFEGKRLLKYIELCCCGENLTDKTLFTISRNCPDLTTLILTTDFTENKATFSDEGLTAILNSCPNLHTLYIEECPGVTGNAFHALSQRISLLEEVSFTGSANCTEHNFEALVKACPGLQRLDISRCANLSDRWVDLLIYYSQNLSKLSIGRESGVSEVAIHTILKKLPNLAVYEGYVAF